MAERKWTQAQKDAFLTENGDLLVCAAAGSGKTAVLTERIIRSITADDPSDITSKLIVTFTKAAASELKMKISKAISEKMGEDHGNMRLRRQLLALDRAQISTIDSFCLSVVSAHFTELGLSASVKVGGDAEIILMKKDIMEQTIDAAYEKGDADFLNLIDNFTSLRDDRISELFIRIYNTVSSYPEGTDYIRISAERLEQTAQNGIGGTVYGKQIEKVAERLLKHYVSVYKWLTDLMLADGTQEKSLPVIQSETSALERIESVGDLSEKLKMIKEFGFERLPANKSKTRAYIRFEGERKSLKDDIKALSVLMSVDEHRDRIAAGMSARLCRSLWQLISDFERRYSEEKKRFSVIDFADAERMTYNLLIKDGKPTAVAKSIASRYEQIYIDEYQDINRIQDDIFASIADKNRFMVGDIKQSIYGFRGAVPDIFAEYREKFPDRRADSVQDCSRVFLSHNFRSDKPILDFANHVCNSLFENSSGRVPFDAENDSLRFPDDKENVSGKKPELIVIAPDGSTPPEVCEAAYVADKIRTLIEGGRSASDIAILLRSTEGSEQFFRNELKKRGIACESRETDNFLEMPEILLMLALLGAIDNPRRDMALAGAMKSPVFGITLDELIGFRSADRNCCLYESLCRAVENGNFEKGRVFLDFLNDCRRFAEGNSTDKLVRYIYRKTALPSIVSGITGNPDAPARLRTFYDIARTFESGSFRGLHNFMRYIAEIESGEKSLIKTASNRSHDAVRILSIHKSKGLEFPVVFVCRTNGQVNLKDSQGDLLSERDMGFAFSLSTGEGYAKYNPITRRAVAERIIDNTIDEEMRVLYVALTRPREELYVTGSAGSPEDFIEKCIEDGENRDFFVWRAQKSYLKWILSTVGNDDSVCDLRTAKIDDDFVNNPKKLGLARQSDDDRKQESTDVEELRRRMEFVYPHRAEAELPSKAAVSALYPSYLDDDSRSEVRYHFDSVPDFLRPDKKPTGAEIGTATHLFMQFCDFDNAERYGAAAELARLLDNGFIDKTSAALVRLDCVERFFGSELFGQMKNAAELHREYRFLIELPASDFTADDEKHKNIGDAGILVQGVIDCFFVLPDGTVKLVDYKTDRVYPKNSEDAVKKIADEYKNQLSYYAKAIKKLCGRTVSSAVIYAFDIGMEIPVEL